MNRIIGAFVRNGVAANLLMALIVTAGIAGILTLPVQVFPEFSLDAVEVRVVYPGASPNEIQDSIIRRIEEQIEGIDGVDAIVATAAEGLGVVRVSFLRGEDVARKLDEIKSEIDRITTFPLEAEEPQIQELDNRSRVIEIALSGEVPERSLRELAYKAKDELSLNPMISLVEVAGARDYEISIEVSQDTQREYGLSLPEIARIIGAESLDLPGGSITTSSEEITLRTLGRNFTQGDYEEIVLLTGDNGAQVRLGDVARIRDGFEDDDYQNLLDGKPTVFVQVFRIGNERVLAITHEVERYLEEELAPSLPEGVEVRIWRNDADELSNRLDLLMKNGAIGLILVIIALTLFLELTIAFWVSVGIFIAFTGAFSIMGLAGLTINQLSLFGFILAIGIVVDDAIVVGENIYAQYERGLSPRLAAATGAARVASPVIFGVLTTVMAFLPLLFTPGTIGKFLFVIPAIVIIVLLLSLIESLLILPRHLSHMNMLNEPGRQPGRLSLSRARALVSSGLQAFVNGPLHRALLFSTSYPLVTLLGGLSTIVLAIGIITAGYVKIGFFPEVEDRFITVTLELEPGTPIEETRRATDFIVARGQEIAAEFEARSPVPVVQAVNVVLGRLPETGGGPAGTPVSATDTNKAAIVFELLEPSERDFSSKAFIARWREAVGEVPGAIRLFFSADLVTLGEPVQVEIAGPTAEQIGRAVAQVEAALAEIPGVFDIRNDLDAGKREISLALRPEARSYGLSLEAVATQVRAAFFGIEALRVQRGRDEVRVYVRLPEAERQALSDLQDLRIETPGGAFVPLRQVATLGESVSPTTISRRDGRRIVTITADLDETAITSNGVAALLAEGIVAELGQTAPEVAVFFGGEQRAQGDALTAQLFNSLLALLAIYAILAISFRSYLQPIIVLSAIPFGVVGAILGHLIVGINLQQPSLFGIIGLSGVIINGALVMVDFMNEAYQRGASPRSAVLIAAKGRFRPVFLTSATTFLGVFPLILEQSVQAQFLVPIAVSVGFGVIVGTFILMLIVPAVTMLLDRYFNVFAGRLQEIPDSEVLTDRREAADRQLLS